MSNAPQIAEVAALVGAALAKRCFDLKWIERVRDGRALVTPAGRRGLLASFGLTV